MGSERQDIVSSYNPSKAQPSRQVPLPFDRQSPEVICPIDDAVMVPTGPGRWRCPECRAEALIPQAKEGARG